MKFARSLALIYCSAQAEIALDRGYGKDGRGINDDVFSAMPTSSQYVPRTPVNRLWLMILTTIGKSAAAVWACVIFPHSYDCCVYTGYCLENPDKVRYDER